MRFRIIADRVSILNPLCSAVFPNPPLSAPLQGQGQGRSNSQSSSTASTPLTQLDSLPLASDNTPDTLADNEDKRMRNTLACERRSKSWTLI
jgi:hypothetical protein